jgi:predicted nuclease of predicted toxin-antitoxin system
VAWFYADENFALATVGELRQLGHDVLTAREAGNANDRVPDHDVLAFAHRTGRILLTRNRRDFLRLHGCRVASHSGIVICSEDPDFSGQALRIDAAVAAMGESTDWLVRVNRSG